MLVSTSSPLPLGQNRQKHHLFWNFKNPNFQKINIFVCSFRYFNIFSTDLSFSWLWVFFDEFLEKFEKISRGVGTVNFFGFSTFFFKKVENPKTFDPPTPFEFFFKYFQKLIENTPESWEAQIRWENIKISKTFFLWNFENSRKNVIFHIFV